MTIYVLERHPLMCQAISSLLHKINPSKKVIEVYAFSKLQEAILINGPPEAFIVDPLMAGIHGATGIKQLKNDYPTIPLIVFSSVPREEAETICLAAGADLYIEKTTSVQHLFHLIGQNLGLIHQPAFSQSQQPESEKFIKLSRRQKQLLSLVDAGLGNDDIGKKLDISSHTVKVHLWRLYRKLGIHSRTQLTKFARDHGLL